MQREAVLGCNYTLKLGGVILRLLCIALGVRVLPDSNPSDVLTR